MYSYHTAQHGSVRAQRSYSLVQFLSSSLNQIANKTRCTLSIRFCTFISVECTYHASFRTVSILYIKVYICWFANVQLSYSKISLRSRVTVLVCAFTLLRSERDSIYFACRTTVMHYTADHEEYKICGFKANMV